MNRLSILIAVCFFSSLLPAQTTTSFHATGEGAIASANVNGASFTLDVSRGDFSGQPSTLLFLFLSTSNADGSFTQIFGSGAVPDQAFTNAGMEQMDLNLDTSQAPGLQLTQCNFTFTPFFQSTCSAASNGILQVHWNNNKIDSNQVMTDIRQSFAGSLSVHSHEDLDESSADASGSVLGITFASRGTVQMNRDSQITITH